MERRQFMFVESMLERYPHFNNEIERRKQELRVSNNAEHDENIGGGRAQNKENHGFEGSVIKENDDWIIRRIDLNKKSISEQLDLSSELVEKIINELYFKKHSVATIDSLALKWSISRAQIARMRQKFFVGLYPKLVTV